MNTTNLNNNDNASDSTGGALKSPLHEASIDMLSGQLQNVNLSSDSMPIQAVQPISHSVRPHSQPPATSSHEPPVKMDQLLKKNSLEIFG